MKHTVLLSFSQLYKLMKGGWGNLAKLLGTVLWKCERFMHDILSSKPA